MLPHTIAQWQKLLAWCSAILCLRSEIQLKSQNQCNRMVGIDRSTGMPVAAIKAQSIHPNWIHTQNSLQILPPYTFCWFHRMFRLVFLSKTRKGPWKVLDTRPTLPESHRWFATPPGVFDGVGPPRNSVCGMPSSAEPDSSESNTGPFYTDYTVS